MHVQRHSSEMTFTLRSAVKSIRAHITGRPKVEILLMLTGGHTDYMKKQKKTKHGIRSTGDKRQETRRRAKDQSPSKGKERYFFTLNSFYTKRNALLPFLVHLFYILWPKNITDLIGPKCDA